MAFLNPGLQVQMLLFMPIVARWRYRASVSAQRRYSDLGPLPRHRCRRAGL